MRSGVVKGSPNQVRRSATADGRSTSDRRSRSVERGAHASEGHELRLDPVSEPDRVLLGERARHDPLTGLDSPAELRELLGEPGHRAQGMPGFFAPDGVVDPLVVDEHLDCRVPGLPPRREWAPWTGHERLLLTV